MDTFNVAEIQYFFRLQYLGAENTLAMVSLYSPPDMQLLADSHQTLYACEYRADRSLAVINVKTIKAVVAMPPLPRTDAEISSGKYQHFHYLG